MGWRVGRLASKAAPERFQPQLGGAAGIVRCFADVDAARVDNLFFALSSTLNTPGIQTEDEAIWLNELAALATVRSLNLNHLSELMALGKSSLPSNVSRAGLVPTRDRDLAALTFTRLVTGLHFDGHPAAVASRWIDVEHMGDRSDLVPAILRALQAELEWASGTSGRRPNPDAKERAQANADEDLLADLEVDFRTWRDEGLGSGVCVRRPEGLPTEHWLAALRQLADKLYVDVIGLAAVHDQSMTLGATRLRPATLVRTLAGIYKRLEERPFEPPGRPSPKPPATEGAEATDQATTYQWDFFISHASEDKQEFVEPLVRAMRDKKKWRVWYDKDQMTAGDSLLDAIEAGLKGSCFAVAVISPRSLNKPGWVKMEWETMLTWEINLGGKRLIPVTYDIEFE